MNKYFFLLLLSSLLVGIGDEKQWPLIKIENGEHKFKLPCDKNFQFQLETNPSTGYQWEIICPQEIKYELLEQSQKDSQPLLLGRMEMKILRIQPTKRGQFTLILNYRRLWEEKILFVQKIFLEVE